MKNGIRNDPRNGLNARAAMLSIAESYERIAADAERRLAAKLLRVPT
jgi:hypothetical protein